MGIQALQYNKYEPFIDRLIDLGYQSTEHPYCDKNTYHVMDENAEFIYVFRRDDRGFQKVKIFHKPITNEFMRNMLETHGCPNRLIDEVLNNKIKDTTAIKAVKQFVSLYPVNIMLIGKVNTGKTFSTIWALKELIKNNIVKDFYFIEAYNIRKAERNGNWGYVFDEKVPLLVIDDLGTESKVSEIKFESQDKQAMMLEIVNNRYSNNKLSTLITCNFGSKDDIKQRYGDRFLSRLERWGKIIVIGD